MKILPWLLLAALAPSQDAPDGEWERPWNGLLPDRHQGFGDEEHRGSNWLATRILDAATGRPVPGARLVRTPECIDDRRFRHDAVMSVGTADADGIARVPAQGHLFRDDSHWMVLADGFAPAETYGFVPVPEFCLLRGEPMSFRVIDPLGRPVPGAVMEYLGGCSHGTPGARAVAGPDGLVSFPRLDPNSGQFWISGPGIEFDLLPVPACARPASDPKVVAVGFGGRYEGRVLDLLGEPVPGCVVRVRNERRGPVAMAGPDGRFVLEGAEVHEGNPPWSTLWFFHPANTAREGMEGWIDDVYPGIPFIVVVTPAGVVKEEETARVVVRARDPGGRSVAGVAFGLVHRETGRGPSSSTGSEEEDDVLDAVPGNLRVIPTGRFDAFTFDPVEVRATAGEATVVVLPVRPQARLRIQGEWSENADLHIAVEGAQELVSKVGDGWSPPLPASGPAVLRVTVDGRPPFFFPVGPAKDGFREVAVVIPPNPRPVPVDGLGTKLVRVRALAAGEGGQESAYEESEVEPGKMVVVTREGWRTLRVVAPGKDLDLRWGSAALRLTLLQDARIPTHPLVLVDGEVYDAPEGILHLRGFEPGPHRVVVAIRDEVRGGRELRLVLKDGETRERTVTLGEE